MYMASNYENDNRKMLPKAKSFSYTTLTCSLNNNITIINSVTLSNIIQKWLLLYSLHKK